jgi:hypothetical protein
VPPNHPLRKIRALVRVVLSELSRGFGRLLERLLSKYHWLFRGKYLKPLTLDHTLQSQMILFQAYMSLTTTRF